MELKSEFGLWLKTTLNPGSELLMDLINLWLIRTTTQVLADLPDEQALQLKKKDFAARSKAKSKTTKKRTYPASFRWMKESGLILNQEILLSLCVRDFEESNQSSSTLSKKYNETKTEQFNCEGKKNFLFRIIFQKYSSGLTIVG